MDLSYNIKKSLAFYILVNLLLACNNHKKNSTNTSEAIAKVNSSTLYKKDLTGYIPKGLTKKDSNVFVTNFINSWISNEVFYQQANNYLTEEELDIQKQLDEYKKELISYNFQLKLVNEKLDTIITNKQIEEYYNTNSQNFLLKNNIVKVIYIKTPINIPNLLKLKKLCYSSNPKDAELLNSMCIQYANNYFMNNTTWLMFDDLKKEIYQLKEVPEYSLQNGKTFEFTDATSFYFLKIIEVKSKNTLSPLAFEKKNIKNMLINMRKQKLITAIKKDFLDLAKRNKEIEIYN